jgi:hypothetical protein
LLDLQERDGASNDGRRVGQLVVLGFRSHPDQGILASL